MAGKLQWVHVCSPYTLTHFGVHAKRGTEATDAIGILPRFRGVSVHDGWKPYQTYMQCRHELCNVNHLRVLTFVEEELHQPWAGHVKTLLQEMKAAVASARASGLTQLPPLQRQSAADPLRGSAPRRAGRQSATTTRASGQPTARPTQAIPARNLLERLWLGQAAVLAFLENFVIPFDNNQAERDLRMFKDQQKVPGCFRADAGAQAYCRIRGFLSTLRKRQHVLLQVLHAVFTGRPLLPALGGVVP